MVTSVALVRIPFFVALPHLMFQTFSHIEPVCNQSHRCGFVPVLYVYHTTFETCWLSVSASFSSQCIFLKEESLQVKAFPFQSFYFHLLFSVTRAICSESTLAMLSALLKKWFFLKHLSETSYLFALNSVFFLFILLIVFHLCIK